MRRSGAAALLAVGGGLAILLLLIYATVYYPLHYHYPVYFGEALRYGDVIAGLAAATALWVGIRTLRDRTRNSALDTVLLLAAGGTTLLLTVLWAFASILHLPYYPSPFYSGLVYFAQLGQAHLGSVYLQVPLALASAAVTSAGILTVRPRRMPTPPRPYGQ